MRIYIFIFVMIALSNCTPAPDEHFTVALVEETQTNPMTYWEDKTRMGANSFINTPPPQEYFDSFAAYGGEWMRLTWTKWESASGKAFLIGDPSNYTGLVEADLEVLKDVVARADKSGIKIVLTPLSLPGAVWTQHNGNEIDNRIYTDKTYWAQSAAFWTDLAREFKDSPTIVAYNLLNEPTPERPAGYESGTAAENIAWYKTQAGSARDLPALYAYITGAIRTTDTKTPIMIDGGFFGSPEGFSYFPDKLNDENVLYAFHMYQPWAATSVWNIRNGSKLTYPGEMKIWGKTQIWDADRVADTIQKPLDWAARKNIDPSHIVMSEFGCHRYLKWCPAYLEDILTAADAKGLHWAFYTYRSDNWGGMDYELGQNPPSKSTMGITAEEFWALSDQNRLDELPRSNTEVFKPISRRLKQNLIATND